MHRDDGESIFSKSTMTSVYRPYTFLPDAAFFGAASSAAAVLSAPSAVAAVPSVSSDSVISSKKLKMANSGQYIPLTYFSDQ